MIRYFVYALIALLILSLVKIKGKRVINLKRMLFMLALLPLVLLIVFFSSVIIVMVLITLVVIFVVAYIFLAFGRKKGFRGKIVVVK